MNFNDVLRGSDNFQAWVMACLLRQVSYWVSSLSAWALGKDDGGLDNMTITSFAKSVSAAWGIPSNMVQEVRKEA